MDKLPKTAVGCVVQEVSSEQTIILLNLRSGFLQMYYT